MFNHMCLVITTAIFADFIADFLTPVKTNNYNYEICFAQHIFIRTGETFFVNMLCMHAIADACLNLEGRGGGGGGVQLGILTEIQGFLPTCPGIRPL